MEFKKHWTDRIGIINFRYRKQLAEVEQRALDRFKTATGRTGKILSDFQYTWETRKIKVYWSYQGLCIHHEYCIEEL